MGGIASIISNNLFVYRPFYHHRRFTATKRNTGAEVSEQGAFKGAAEECRYADALHDALNATAYSASADNFSK